MRNRRSVCRWLFLVYMLFLIFVVLLKLPASFGTLLERLRTVRGNREIGYWNLNLIPGATIRLYLGQIHRSYARQNLLANVLAFVPLGLFLPVCFDRYRNFMRTILDSLVFLVAAELFQLVSMMGSCDVDDVILNLLGIAVGYGIFRILKKLSDP